MFRKCVILKVHHSHSAVDVKAVIYFTFEQKGK